MPAPLLGPAFAATATPPVLTPRQAEVRDAILASDRPEDYEAVSCPCGEAGRDLVLSEVERHGLPCRNLICTTCGLVRQSPRWRPDRLARFYASEYRSLYRSSIGSAEAYLRDVAASEAASARARWVEITHDRYGGGSPVIIELGAGGGWNLAGLPPAWRRVGYDVHDEYRRLGTRLFGVELRHGFIEQALPALAEADIVMLSHVVEHLSAPEAELSRIAARLRPGALLLIEVPGIFRIHRSNLDVRSYLQNAHLYTFSAVTLRATCVRAGLAVIESDDTVRAVCRTGARPGVAPREDWRRTVGYLRHCARGFGVYRRLGALPVIGRMAGGFWRRTYYAMAGLRRGGELRAASP
jgi:SAM-dependent methyltransferase